MKRLAGIFLGLALLGAAGHAQQTVAPTPQTTETNRGENVSGFNILQSFETGYRFRTVDGNYGKYRSDVNYGNGIRLLGSNLAVYSRNGHGKYFDEIVLNTQGLGNDPYQFSSLRVQKNGWYRYDLTWRLNEYYNPGLTITNGQHLWDVRQRLQDHNLVIRPQSRLRFLAGYSKVNETGPALTTVNLLEERGDEFPLFANVRRNQDEYRIGGEWHAGGLVLTAVRAWEFFKEDTPYFLTGLQPGNNTTDANTLTSYNRAEPYHGMTPSWRVGLIQDRSRWLAINGRFTYSGSRRDYVQSENALGTTRFGDLNRQILIFGNAQRPVTTANLNISVFPTARLTITNHSAFHQIRITGDSRYREFNNATLDLFQTDFQFLGIRTFSNTTDIKVDATRWFSITSGYHVASRRIQSVEQTALEGFAVQEDGRQNNILHAGRLGFVLRPMKPLTVNVEGEVGRANRPFYPTSEKEYQVLNGRVQYRTKTLVLGALARTYYNFTPVALSTYSSKSRQYGFNAAWTPRDWLGFDLNYSKLHLDTVGGIAYFVDSNLISGENSIYRSNLHFGNAGVRLSVKKRADLYFGYSRTQDTGDGRSSPVLPIGASLSVFQAVQVFPLTFESPLARVSVPLRKKLRFNLGYQFYHYREDFSTRQNYRANTGYTSLTWSF